jgi:hypothetical protein
MQFADFVVSHALELNSQCLRTVAQAIGDAPLADEDLRALRADALRLASLWQMLHWAIGKPAYRQGRRRMARILELVPEAGDWVDRAARQIAGKSDDERRLRAVSAAAERVASRLPAAGPICWAEVGRIFEAESAAWRDAAVLRKVHDGDLVEHGIVRAYQQSRRWCEAYGERPASRKRMSRARRWLRHCVNHLELLQPALSDSGKAHAWYLERLQSNVEKAFLVQRFVEMAGAPGDGGARAPLKAKALARVQSLAQARAVRLQARSKKLMVGAFEPDADDFSRAVGRAAGKLALPELELEPLPAAMSPGSDEEAAR